MNNLSVQNLGSYQLIEQVSQGPGGTVYKAYQPNLQRQVAIKVLAEEQDVGLELRERFINEAKTVAKLLHPNIIPIYDVVEGEISYFVMKYVSGTLRDLMGRPMDLSTVSRLIDQIAAALDYAHAQDVLHLNLKPANILWQDEQVWLTDFDLAQVLDLVSQESITGLNIVSLLSTPVYASPEWWAEEGMVDHRADIYSLGIVLYEMVTGVVPFEAEDEFALIVQHLQEPLPEPRMIRADLPAAVSQVMRKALAKQPAARYQQAGELAEALRQALGAFAIQPQTPSADKIPNARERRITNQPTDQYQVLTPASPALPTNQTVLGSGAWGGNPPIGHTHVSPAGAPSPQLSPPSPPSPPSAPRAARPEEEPSDVGTFQRFLARVRQLLPGQSKKLPAKPVQVPPSSSPKVAAMAANISPPSDRDDKSDLENTEILAAPMPPTPKIKRYILSVPPLGGGGMGVVFRAYDPHFERDVALKVLLPKFQQHKAIRDLFDREAKTVARLDHPAIVPVYDYGEEENQPYLVMRLMEKGSLAERFKRQPLTLPEAINVLQRVSAALDHAHHQGVIHRDLKPANILFDQYDHAFLADFGVVKLIQASIKHKRKVVVGTPAYMSPEQAQDSNQIDARSDVYSLGVVLFQILTGKLPFQAKTQRRMILAHLTKPVPNIRQIRPDLPPGSETVIAKAMAKKPAERYKTASELVEALSRVIQQPTIINLSLVGPKQTHQLKVGEFILGRSAQSDIQVDDPRASSRHARLVVDRQQCIVYDEQSTNGTYLNGQRLLTNGVLFNVGDELLLGRTSFSLKKSQSFGIIPLSRLTVGTPVQHVAWSPDGTICAVASQGGVRLWDHVNQQLRGVLAIGQMNTFEQSIAWSPDGKRLLSAGSARFSDDTNATQYALVRMWDLSKPQLQRSIEDLSTPTVQSVAWSPNGYRLALSWGNKIWIWEARTSQAIRWFKGNPTSVKHLIWSPDSTLFASVGEDIRIWNLNQGKQVHHLTHATPITSAAWSPDGTWLAFGTQNGSLCLQQLVTDSTQPTLLTGHSATVTSVAWSPDGTKLLSGSTDHTVRVWDIAKEQELALLQQHTDHIHSVAWSPDGMHFASGSQDGTVQYWELTA